jgi:ribosomal protein S18 acetylase RimI-like enzyme
MADGLELEYLAVHPDYHGRGIATRLVESGIAEAQRLGVDIIVMAYKSAVGVYKRLGFEMVEQLIQDDSKYGGKGEFGVYFMIRKTKKD